MGEVLTLSIFFFSVIKKRIFKNTYSAYYIEWMNERKFRRNFNFLNALYYFLTKSIFDSQPLRHGLNSMTWIRTYQSFFSLLPPLIFHGIWKHSDVQDIPLT